MTTTICGVEILIDDEDFHLITDFNWWKRYKNGTYFISATEESGKSKFFALHRIILNAPRGMQVDHINGNTLDNRKENLRICTPDQNQQNRKMRKDCSSGSKGVYYNKKTDRYESRIAANKKRLFLGSFKTKDEAEQAYVKASRSLYGSFSRV